MIRDQYFYLGESVLYEIPAAANFVVGTFYIVEVLSKYVPEGFSTAILHCARQSSLLDSR